MRGALSQSTADVDLLVAEPCGDRDAPCVERGAELRSLHQQRAGPLVGQRIAERAHDVAAARAAVRLNAQSHVDRCATWPAVADARRIIPPGDSPDQACRNRYAAPATSRPIAAGAVARPGPDAARTSPGA